MQQIQHIDVAAQLLGASEKEIIEKIGEMQEKHPGIDTETAIIKILKDAGHSGQFKKIIASRASIETVSKKIQKKSVYEAMDAFDELLIEEQVVGAKPLIYEIPGKEGPTYTLSMEGIYDAVARMGDIEIEPPTFPEVGGRTIAIARVRNLKNNVVVVGVAEAYSTEKFKHTTLSSKAIRNALRKIIPQKIQQQIIREALEAKSFIVVGGMGR